jgi:hypothetical protein
MDALIAVRSPGQLRADRRVQAADEQLFGRGAALMAHEASSMIDQFV